MHDAFVGVVVGVGKENVPVVRKGLRVHCKAVVLRRDETTLRTFMDARLVMPTIPVSRAMIVMLIKKNRYGIKQIHPLFVEQDTRSSATPAVRLDKASRSSNTQTKSAGFTLTRCQDFQGKSLASELALSMDQDKNNTAIGPRISPVWYLG